MLPFVGANRITPSALQAPPRPVGALASVCGAPPTMSARLSIPPAKKPIDRLSGDQKGNDAPSVSAIGSAVVDPNGRNQSCDCPSTVATKTSLRPSGEIAKETGSVVG